MLSIGLFLSATSGWLGLILLGRLRRARRAVRSAMSVSNDPSRLIDLLRRKLDDLIDRDMLADAGRRGLGEVAIKFREAHDASDLAGLLGAIAKKSESALPGDLIEVIKYLYILQYSLGESVGEIDGCVREVIARLEGLDFHGSRIGQATIPREGELFDARTMWALKAGSRVKQPMGVTLKDESGRLLSKGKVLCQ